MLPGGGTDGRVHRRACAQTRRHTVSATCVQHGETNTCSLRSLPAGDVPAQKSYGRRYPAFSLLFQVFNRNKTYLAPYHVKLLWNIPARHAWLWKSRSRGDSEPHKQKGTETSPFPCVPSKASLRPTLHTTQGVGFPEWPGAKKCTFSPPEMQLEFVILIENKKFHEIVLCGRWCLHPVTGGQGTFGRGPAHWAALPGRPLGRDAGLYTFVCPHL